VLALQVGAEYPAIDEASTVVAGDPVVITIGNVGEDPYSTVVEVGVTIAVALLIVRVPVE
jgi:hypothetical protein